MATGTYIAAAFTLLRDATAAIDWLRNQGVAPQLIQVAVRDPGDGGLRSPMRGDDRRRDLTWFVGIDTRAAGLPASVVRDALRREGGRLLPPTFRIPDSAAA
jgi:hypothetical protein